MAPPLHDSLEGQVALVTGANRGIGRGIAAGLAEHGATVYAGVRDTDYDVPAGTDPVRVDLTDDESMADAVETIVGETGRLDVLVNNAGVGGGGSLEEIEPAEVGEILDVNLRGTIVLTTHALPHLLEAEGGRIVTLSSGLGILSDPIPGEAPAYRASKAGVNALTADLDVNYAEEGLIANSVDPGWVATDLGGEEAPREPAKGAETPIWLARFAPGAPSGAFWKDKEQIDF